MKHNNAVVNAHFHKDWQERVKTWFNQPGKKVTRRVVREKKALRIFPRPTQLLRPVVHPPSARYNMKVRLGRGFTLDELKEAGFNRHEALSFGVAVDHRRRNHSVNSLKANVQRLKEYKARLVIAPRNAQKPKAGEVPLAEVKAQQQVTGVVAPAVQPRPRVRSVKVADLDPKASAFATLRKARSDARLVGVRAKRAAERAEKEKEEAGKR